MKRFFVEKISKPQIKLVGNENKHLAEVLRAKIGEQVIICPNDGNDYIFEITAFDKLSTTLKYVSESVNETETSIDVSVFFSMIRGDRPELIVQKLTELGVKNIYPFISEFTVAKTEKNDRLVRAAHEASKQCGRSIIPNVSRVLSFDEMLNELKCFEKTLFAYEKVNGVSESLRNSLNGNEKKVAIIIGPEGGFSQKEFEAISSKENVITITLGKRILRAETAAIALTAALLEIEGEWEC